jgi:predicted Ser/Thr protein kinase
MMMTEIENTLYILENLSTTDSEDHLESVEIEVYYGDDQGNEGMSTTYDMPTIADKAIEVIIELRNEKAELEKVVDDLLNNSSFSINFPFEHDNLEKLRGK